MRPLIEEGHVYIAQPPLYRFEVGNEHFTYTMRQNLKISNKRNAKQKVEDPKNIKD